jgi:hypothetical protein
MIFLRIRAQGAVALLTFSGKRSFPSFQRWAESQASLKSERERASFGAQEKEKVNEVSG